MSTSKTTLLYTVPVLLSILFVLGLPLYANGTVFICHAPATNPQTMEVPTEELPAYLAAGDLSGTCESNGIQTSSSSASVSSSESSICVPVECPENVPEGCTRQPPIIVDECQVACGEVICSSSSAASGSGSSSSVNLAQYTCPMTYTCMSQPPAQLGECPPGTFRGWATIPHWVPDDCAINGGLCTATICVTIKSVPASSSSSSSSVSSSSESSAASSETSSSVSSAPVTPVTHIDEIRANIEMSRDLNVQYRGNRTAAGAAAMHALLINYGIDDKTPYLHTYTFEHESLRPQEFASREDAREWIEREHALCCSLYRYILRLQDIHPEKAEHQLDWFAKQLSQILGEEYHEMRDALQGKPHDHEHTDAFLKSITESACLKQ